MIDDMARVIRFEQRGCGWPDPKPPYDVATCLMDLEHIRHHYQIERRVIAGYSWGADLALAYPLEHALHVADLICIASGRIHNDREWHQAYRRRKEYEGEALPEFEYPFNEMVNEQVNAAWKKYIQKPDLLKAISQVKIPILFIYAEQDIRPSWPTEQLAQLMRQARFKVIRGAAHFIWLNRSGELRRMLRDFLQSLNRRQSTIAKRLNGGSQSIP